MDNAKASESTTEAPKNANKSQDAVVENGEFVFPE